jgi:hypothetical protein
LLCLQRLPGRKDWHPARPCGNEYRYPTKTIGFQVHEGINKVRTFIEDSGGGGDGFFKKA